ncbi:MAG: hypothetical protein PUD94_06005 [Prevotellaceae bacterium]|nr:hypothetical protein [Prevotellaceae bacterium]
MNKIKSLMSFVLLSCLMAVGLTACSDDDLSTNQYQQGVHLNVFGPSPVMRGGSVHFYGSNLDQVKQVLIPGMDPVTNFEILKAGIPSEIVVLLDKEKPQPGKITLITNTDEKIVTLTDLTYIEGIEYASDNQFAPAVVQPGAVLTINGEYLNLVNEVIFADNVTVNAEDFVSQSRYKIEVTVPEEARTGKVILSDGAEIPNWIYSDEILQVTTPIVDKVTTPRGTAAQQETVACKLGETVTVSGQFFNLVAGVTIGDAETSYITVEEDQLTVSDDGKTLSFTLPAEAPDGDIDLICRSGVAIPVAILETVAPAECVAAPNPAKNGQPLTISGKDLDVVASIEMPNVSDAVEFNCNDGKIVIPAVPASAQEGNLVLRMANGKGVEVAYTLVKPVVTAYNPNPVSAGGALTVQGKDLDLVASVNFGEGSDIVEASVAADGTSMTLTVPMNAASGAPTLNLINGTTVVAPEITVNEATFCYVKELPGEDVELKAGAAMTLVVANGDKLTGVEVNGAAVQYVLTEGNKLIIGLPESCGAGTKIRLVSSNGEITYTLDVTPNTEVNTVIWTGAVDLNAWSINWQFGDGTQSAGEDPLAFTKIALAEGDVIHLYATAYNDWWQIQFFNGHWEAQTSIGDTFGNGNNINSGIASLEKGYLDIVVTAQMLTEFTTYNDWGYCWILQGEGVVITKISVTHYNSLEQNISSSLVRQDDQGQNISLPINMAWDDSGRFRILIDKDPAIKDMNLKAGKSVMYFYTSGTGQLQINNGNWGSWTTLADWENADDKKMELVLTQDMIDWLKGTQSDGWSSTGMIIQGDGMTLKKVTILP